MILTDKKLILEKEFMPKVFETQLLHYLKVMLVLAVGIIYFFSKTVSAAWFAVRPERACTERSRSSRRG